MSDILKSQLPHYDTPDDWFEKIHQLFDFDEKQLTGKQKNYLISVAVADFENGVVSLETYNQIIYRINSWT